jgi:soluble lytic murein transglycosylase
MYARLTVLFIALISLPVTALTLEEEREVYEKSQDLLDNKNVDDYLTLRPLIQNYTLTPYLDYRAFLIDISDRKPREVEAFMQDFREFPFSQRIRAAYLDALVKEDNWETFYQFQSESPRTESYQCSYYYAQLKNGKQDIAFGGAQDLWLNGSSISDQCDLLFEEWHLAGLRSDELILKRMSLAFEKRNANLLKYLMKMPSSQSAKNLAEDILLLYRQPEQVVVFANSYPPTEFNQHLSAMAVKKVARTDPQVAIDLLEELDFENEKMQDIIDYIAYRLINTEEDELAQWRDIALSNSHNQSWLERRARLAIQQADWQGLEFWIDRLPASAQNTYRWLFWKGRAEIEQGDVAKGEKKLASILGERNFYSVAAAHLLDTPVVYYSASSQLNLDSVNKFQSSLDRIEELLTLDKVTAAKSEWRWLLTRAGSQNTKALAQYAASKRWHHFTVTATIEGRMWDYTSLRFPLAHQWWFEFYAAKQGIDPIMLMSVARQESAMDQQAISPVGARGIMQIMPNTAKYTANKFGLDYHNSHELFQVGKNIEIGSHYLGGLLTQFENNRIFAYAAYNAGPHRVTQWQERTSGNIDAYAFIESIPFKETRGYVQNILMFEIYYRNLLGLESELMSEYELTYNY